MILNKDKVDLLLRYSGGKYYALKQLSKCTTFVRVTKQFNDTFTK